MGLAAAMALLATACGGGNRASGRLAVSARTVAPAGAATATAAPAGLDLGDGIVLTRVRLAVQRIQLAGGSHSVFDADVPAGTYRELRIAVGPVSDAAAGSAAAAMSGRSVVVDGTIRGAPFTFASG